MFLLPDRRAFKEWGLEGAADDRAGGKADARDASVVACREFAREQGLTLREEEVLMLLAQGRTSSEIEAELSISKETVRSHRKNIYGKCGVHSRDELLDLMGGMGRPR